MTLLHGALLRLKRRAPGDKPLMDIPNPVLRHRIVSMLTVVVLLIGFGYLAWWSLWNKCGNGMTATGSPYVCVGLDLDSTAFKAADPLTDLERIIANDNKEISGQFATIVVLQDMTPDLKNGSVTLQSTRNRIEGAIAAVSRANDPATGGIPKIKLLLANYGLGADSWPQAVDTIKQNLLSEHIVAVTGIDQSLDTTRAAVAALSDAGISVVGSNVTADNMNVAPGPAGKLSKKFFRVAPTNTEEAKAASAYIKQHAYHKVLLVNDVNEKDSYAYTLSSAFSSVTNDGANVDNTEPYLSPDEPLNGATREQLMAAIFANMHADICEIRPDLIYFAGRGVDLKYFLTSLSHTGACGLPPLDVLTGDDASNLVGGPVLMSGGLSFTVFYTGIAYTDEWRGFPPSKDYDYAKNYQDFANEFAKKKFASSNLDDGQAMVSYDAVYVAVTATKADPVATTNPDTVAAFIIGIHCQHPVPGASGPIAFDANDIPKNNGNPINKAMPILQLHADGTVTQKELAWPTGHPLDPNSTCGANVEPPRAAR